MLTTACKQYKLEEVKLDNKKSKKDELILKLVTNEKLEDKQKVLSTIDVDKVETVELLTKSYLKNGKFQTLVKIKFKEEKNDELKKYLEDQEAIEKAYNNYIYDANPFDMIQESSEQISEEQPVEFEAAHHKLIHTKEALKNARGEGITVAVTDTGVAYDHTDLVANIWMNESENPMSSNNLEECMNGIDDDGNSKVDDCLGWDFARNDNDPAPNNSSEKHGTHVAGIVASMENGEGTVGVAPDAKVMSIKFYGSGIWTSTTILNSYVYAVDNGAKIINTSFNVDIFSRDEVYLSVLDYVEANGAIVVNSAGNNGRMNPPRARLSKVLFVANTAVADARVKDDERVSSSNYGLGIDISAPGYKINSTIMNNKYQTATGTSMSSPVIAGALALIWSKHPEWSKEKVISRLLSTADNIDAKNHKRYHAMLGSGRVNLERALGDEKQRPISIAGFADRLKTISDRFSIKVNGLVDWNTLTDDTVSFYRLSDDVDLNSTNFEDLISDSASELEVSIADKAKLSYGSNKFELINTAGNLELGKYLLKVNSNLKDHFADSLDGNKDGLVGEADHYYTIAELKPGDYFSPLLKSYELLGEKVRTPDSQNIRYRFEIEDDFSGYKRIVVEFRNSGDFSEHHVVRCKQECLMEDGSIEIELPIKSLTTDGKYYIRHILIEDKSGRASAYYVRTDNEKVYRMPSHAKKTIELKDSYFELKGFQIIDVLAPIILSKPEISSEAFAGSTIDLKLKIKEEISGVRRMIGIFSAIDVVADFRKKVSSVIYPRAVDQALSFKLAKDQAEGEYYLRLLFLEDKKMNKSRYVCDKLTMKFEGTDIECPIVRVRKDNS